MKGIMVTLLMFMTTGIVVGQQGSSSSNSFNPAATGTQNDLVKPLEIGVSEDAIRAIRAGKVLVSRIEPVDPTSGEKLHRDVISGVSLFQEGKNLSTLTKTSVQGRDDGDGVLRFGLTEANLRALQNNQLKMDFSASQRGKYQEIEVFYVAPTQNNSVIQPLNRPNPASGSSVFTPTRPRTPTPDDSRSSGQFPFGPRGAQANNTNQTAFIPLPAPHEPGDPDFMGPALPVARNWSPNRQNQNNPALIPNQQTDFANNQNRQNGFANNQNQNQNRQNGVANNQNQNQKQIETTGGWRFPNRNNDSVQNNGFQNNTAQNDPQSRIDSLKAKWELEKRQADYEEDLRRQAADRLRHEQEAQELAKRQWEQEQFQRNQRTAPLTPILNGPIDPRMTTQELAYQKAMWELEQKEDLLKTKEASLLRKENLIGMQQQMYNNSLGYQSLRTNMAQDVNPNWERSSGITPGTHFYPEGPVVERTRTPVTPNDYARRDVNFGGRDVSLPENGFRSPSSNTDVSPRVATATKRGINGYAASVPGPSGINKAIGSGASNGSKAGSRDDRVDGFVLFLLFCSLGLNIYLAFISRGFYVRYHELADELRETFSTTH